MKIWNYVVICFGVVFLLKIAGLPTGADGILNLVGFTFDGSNVSSAGIGTSDIWDAIFGSAGIFFGIGVGIAIGIATKSSPENFIILPIITGTLGLFIQTFSSIINYSIGNYPLWISTVVVFIFGILGLGFTVALIEFFRGTD